MPRKTCSSCGKRRARSAFYSHPQTADRLRGKCKPCMLADQARYHVEVRRPRLAAKAGQAT